MRYCTKCGSPLHEEAILCPGCGCAVPRHAKSGGSNAALVIVKILLILTIVSLVWSGAQILFTTSVAGGEIETLIKELANDPDLLLMLDTTSEQLETALQSFVKVFSFISFVPLLWIVPMTINIFTAPKKGKKLGTGFKVCVMLFANFIAGIILLCIKD